MAGRESAMGPTGDHVRKNLKRIRTARGLTYAELSRQLEAAGRPIPPLGLRRIESGDRRVDVDDLTALAYVLWVNPVVLLAPEVRGRRVTTELTGYGTSSSEVALSWLSGDPLCLRGQPGGDERFQFLLGVMPRVTGRSDLEQKADATRAARGAIEDEIREAALAGADRAEIDALIEDLSRAQERAARACEALQEAEPLLLPAPNNPLPKDEGTKQMETMIFWASSAMAGEHPPAGINNQER